MSAINRQRSASPRQVLAIDLLDSANNRKFIEALSARSGTQADDQVRKREDS